MQQIDYKSYFIWSYALTLDFAESLVVESVKKGERHCIYLLQTM